VRLTTGQAAHWRTRSFKFQALAAWIRRDYQRAPAVAAPLPGKIDDTRKENQKALKSYTEQVWFDSGCSASVDAVRKGWDDLGAGVKPVASEMRPYLEDSQNDFSTHE
jgi:hypothetical protein